MPTVSTTPQETVETPDLKIWLENGIAYCIIKTRKIDGQVAREMVSLRHQFFKGRHFPSIVDVRSVKSVTKEARDIFASHDGTVMLKAAALVTSSVIGKMLATFFMTFNKPNIPIKLFSAEDEAVEWLASYKG